MANPNVGQQIAHAWQAYVGGGPEDNIHDEYSQLKRMEKGKAFKSFTGGRSIIGTIEYALNTTVQSITAFQTLDTTAVDVFDEYEYQWKQYGGTVNMTTVEEAQNRGENAKFSLLKGKLENLRQSMRRKINTDLFGLSSGNDLHGLQSLVPDDPTTGTIGGINRATYAFWRSQQALGTKTTTAYDNLRSSMRTIRLACAKGQGVKFPDYFVTGPTTSSGYESLLIANERVVGKDSEDANAAFAGDIYYFGKAKVYWDDACADARMYALNNSDLMLAYQSGYWFKGYPAVDPANQLLDIFKVETQAQQFTKNSRHLGVITVIT